jgi:hypothetical protein
MALKEERVLSTWGTWAAFTEALLRELADSRVIDDVGDDWWALSPEFVPGKRYRLMKSHDIGLVVHDEKTRKAREEQAAVRLLVKEFATKLRRHDLGVQYAEQADGWLKELSEPASPAGRHPGRRQAERRPPNTLTTVYKDFWNTHNDGWYSMFDVARWWNEHHPDEEPISYHDAGTWRRSANEAVKAGQMQKRPETLEERDARLAQQGQRGRNYLTMYRRVYTG